MGNYNNFSKRNQDAFRGCLIGGAIGDALGWPVEFMHRNEIIRRYGAGGISDLLPGANGKAEITDDTQMTLFTAEGILRDNTASIGDGKDHSLVIIYRAYRRWLKTQGYAADKSSLEEDLNDGWLIQVDGLHEDRAPGNACLTALRSRVLGTIESPVNNSKGCGGVMRMAPAGLAYSKDKAFKAGADYGAMTHGHSSGYLSAGALAYVIACIVEGQDLDLAFQNTLEELRKYEGHEECADFLTRAIELAKSDIPDIEAINQLGGGWVGDEALAIAAFCALKYRDDFRRALIVSVNHDGDSDSTGAIVGNILGAYLGISHIPAGWINQVELSDVILQVADDLLTGYQEGEDWRKRYPGH